MQKHVFLSLHQNADWLFYSQKNELFLFLGNKTVNQHSGANLKRHFIIGNWSDNTFAFSIDAKKMSPRQKKSTRRFFAGKTLDCHSVGSSELSRHQFVKHYCIFVHADLHWQGTFCKIVYFREREREDNEVWTKFSGTFKK